MRLRASVQQATGATEHRQATLVEGVLVPGEQLPVPTTVEIAQTQSGFFIFHYDANGHCLSDTWHATLVDAKEQARFEFGIEDADWMEVTNGGASMT